jgi:hypothetical protein
MEHFVKLKDERTFLAISFFAPITLLGFTALSVETITKLTLYLHDKSGNVFSPLNVS